LFGKALQKIPTTSQKKTNQEYIYNPIGDVAKPAQIKPQTAADMFASPVPQQQPQPMFQE
jgi:hypothetical protein